MAEQFKSITDARRDLPALAETVEGGSDRVVITNQGEPQAVLLGYEDFKGLLAAVELMNRPRDLAQLHEGLADMGRISFDELREQAATKPAKESLPVGIAPAAMANISLMNSIGRQLGTMNVQIGQLMKQINKGGRVVGKGYAVAAAVHSAGPESRRSSERAPRPSAGRALRIDEGRAANKRGRANWASATPARGAQGRATRAMSPGVRGNKAKAGE